MHGDIRPKRELSKLSEFRYHLKNISAKVNVIE